MAAVSDSVSVSVSASSLTKYPLRRSVVFWLGLFVLSFIVWVWSDSRRTRTFVYRTWLVTTPAPGRITTIDGRFTDDLALDSGRIAFTWNRAEMTGSSLWRLHDPLRLSRNPPKLGGGWVARARAGREVVVPTPGVTVSIYRAEVPMWGLVGGYLACWGGVLLWRRNRWMRLARVMHGRGD